MYTKQTWSDNNASYPLSAARMANIESGILAAQKQKGTYTLYVAASGESQDVKDACDYYCDGTADEVQINAAIDALSSNIVSTKGTQGGTVVLVGRLFTIAAPILNKSFVEVRGAYSFGTVIRNTSSNVPGTSGGMYQLYNNATQYTSLRDVMLDGQGQSTCGVYLNNGTAQEWDAFHRVQDVYVWNVGEDGISAVNDSGGRLRGNMFSRIRVINAGRYGVNSACPDSFYEMVDVGSSANHGFYVGHSNNRFVNCKSWYSQGNGFHITGGRDNQFSGCESQDNEQHGYYIASAKNMFSSCIADSNGHSGAGNAHDGFNIVSNGTVIHACVASEKSEAGRSAPTPAQRYGFNVVGAPKVYVNGMAYGNVTGPSNGTPASGSVFDVVSY